MPDPLRKRTSGFLAALLAIGLATVAVPAAANAATVSVRAESPGFQLVPKVQIQLPATPVAPPGSLDPTHTCPGNSVVGAVATATGGNWSGTWTDGAGWSIDSINSVSATAVQGRQWVFYVNNLWPSNNSPCATILSDGDSILLYPKCTTPSALCFAGEPLIVTAPAIAGPGSYLKVFAQEVTTAFDGTGHGVSQILNSLDATITSAWGRASTTFLGSANVLLQDRGDQTVTLTKGNRVPDRAIVCVTDGADGYCGTTVAPTNPFNPLNYCATTGDDGLCGTTDKRPPVGRITDPVNGKKYSAGTSPRFLRGVTDTDPSGADSVQLRLLRKVKGTATTFVMRRVTVKKRVKGKVLRKTARKKVPVKRKVTRCYYWSITKSDWALLKSCSVVPNAFFKADGDEKWSFEFLSKLPAGTYTLDAQAKDGAGNVDTVPEDGRNHVTFTVG